LTQSNDGLLDLLLLRYPVELLFLQVSDETLQVLLLILVNAGDIALGLFKLQLRLRLAGWGEAGCLGFKIG
jgi:hypothetical protein